jgi:hypothetical protein
MTPPAAAPQIELITDARQALQAVRTALIQIFTSVSQDPRKPQDIARQLGLHKSLAWKLSKIVTSDDPFAVLNHLPGTQGIDLAIDAFNKRGASSLAIEQLRAAIEQLQGVIVDHAENREHLELTLESSGLYEPESKATGGRELAFRGNSMTWGVQTKTLVRVAMLAPGENGLHDSAQIAAMLGFRRLRPDARWRLYRKQVRNDRGQAILSSGVQPIDPALRRLDDPPFILRAFCSDNLPAIEHVPGPEGDDYILPPGQIGNRAVLDYVQGYSLRGLTAYRTEADEYASFAAAVSVPAERLIFDLIYHESIPVPSEPEVAVFGFPHGGMDNPSTQTIRNKLPITCRVVPLRGSPPVCDTPLFPRYGELIDTTVRMMSWNPAELRAVRVTLDYPTMNSTVVVRWPLPPRP